MGEEREMRTGGCKKQANSEFRPDLLVDIEELEGSRLAEVEELHCRDIEALLLDGSNHLSTLPWKEGEKEEVMEEEEGECENGYCDG
jgi:hypothetical protein